MLKILLKRALLKLPISLQTKILLEFVNAHQLKLISKYTDGLEIIPPNDGVIRDLISSRAYHEKLAIEKICSILRPDAIALDIGANVGFWTLPLAKKLRYGVVHAFEPTPSTYLTLQQNISLNRLSNITTYQLGVSDKDGDLPLSTYDGEGRSSGWNTFGNSNTLPPPTSIINAKLTTLDAWWVSAGRPTCQFAKIDVEGFELQVIKGGTEFFRHHRSQPDFFVFMEVANVTLAAVGTAPIAIFSEMNSLGYDMLRIRGGLPKASSAHFDENICENMIVVPQGNSLTDLATALAH
jgi:FkbM family methyltransferase